MEHKHLDLSVFDNGVKCICIATLSKEVIGFIESKHPEFKGIIQNNDVLLWDNRIEYTEKHKGNFRDPEDYYYYLKNIPNIILNPDYIGLRPDNKSIQFIKQYDHNEHNILVAVRISAFGKLSYRTMYPITESQLKDYQNKNRAWKWLTK